MLTVLAGGTGSAKLVRGLAKNNSDDITVIVNIGDNITLHGLYICPDIDTILYTLSNQIHPIQGWGVKDDTYNFLEQISIYGEENWFKIGDKDLALHVMRTKLLKTGLTLTETTKVIADKLNISQKIVPASDQHIETRIHTLQGEMHLQEFWVKHKGEPETIGVTYYSLSKPEPSPEAVNAILNADKIIICPANPVTSISPIINISGIKNALTKVRKKVVAVSPIIGNQPISGPASKLLQSIGVEVSAKGVAGLYSEFISKIIIDESDKKMISDIESMNIKVSITDIMMNNQDDEQKLAQFVSSK